MYPRALCLKITRSDYRSNATIPPWLMSNIRHRRELTPDADGNVTAARENVCTFAVKSPGTLSTRYNRDINKAFDELKQAIISLGGNI